MNKLFKDMTLDERIDYAHGQAQYWRGVLRQLNRELTAITPEERDALRAKVIEAVQAPDLTEVQQTAS